MRIAENKRLPLIFNSYAGSIIDPRQQDVALVCQTGMRLTLACSHKYLKVKCLKWLKCLKFRSRQLVGPNKLMFF